LSSLRPHRPRWRRLPRRTVVERLDQLTASIGRWMAANEPYLIQIHPIERALADPSDPPIQAMLCGTLERMARAEARLLEHPGVTASTTSTDSRATRSSASRPIQTRPITNSACTAPSTQRATSPSSTFFPPAAPRARLCCPRRRAHIVAAQILAIGDNWNDVTMFEPRARRPHGQRTGGPQSPCPRA